MSENNTVLLDGSPRLNFGNKRENLKIKDDNSFCRKTEVRSLLRLYPQEVEKRAGERLIICETIDMLHKMMAEDIASEIKQNNKAGKQTRLILPVGPFGQYPLLAEIINTEKIYLSNCRFFFMDEYSDENGCAVGEDHPLSFKKYAKEYFFDHLDTSCGLGSEQVIFPDEKNIMTLADEIEAGGGIDTCYGGIGIHGHVAFNEPQKGIAALGPRKVRLNDFTVTINAVREKVGGNLECFPRQAFTLGMQQILSAKRIRLYCRNGCEFDWANTILRLALFGTPGDDYPVTHIRNHNYCIITDRKTLDCPDQII